MTDTLFRPEAINANRARLTGAVVAATPPGSRFYTGIVAAVVLAAVLFLTFGRYATHVDVRGILSEEGGISGINSPELSTVRRVYVKEGQTVAKGDRLVSLSLTEGRGAEGEGLSTQIGDLARQDEELILQGGLATRLSETELEALRRRRESLTASQQSLRKQIDLMASQIDLARENAERAARLAKRGAGTQQQVEEARSTIIARELEREGIRERLIDQIAALRALETDIAARSITVEQAQSELNQRRAALNEQRTDLVRRENLILSAPRDGRVGYLDAKPGVRIGPDHVLASIVPRDSQLEVTLFAPTRAIGFVTPGKEVRVRFDAFPYQKYGTAQGRVTWVSEVPTLTANLPEAAGAAGAAEPMYRVRVALDMAAFERRNRALALRPGMTLTANLVLEERALWEVFFAPVLETMRH